MHRIVFVMLVLIGLAVLLTTGASAQGPRACAAAPCPTTIGFTYQGQLQNASGPVNATCALGFSLWDAATGGTQIGSTLNQSLVVSNGYFTSNPLDFGSSAYNGSARYLQVAVQCPGDTAVTTLSRQLLTSAPYAVYASNATNATSATTAMNFSGFLNGDIDGTQFATNVIKLRGVPISTTVPSSGQVLRYDGAQWTPATLSTASVWNLGGNAGTNANTQYLGTSDNARLTLKVNGVTGWRLAPFAAGTPSIIGGFSGNWVDPFMEGAFIGGGGAVTAANSVSGAFGVVAGGQSNQAGPLAHVGGGYNNIAAGEGATIAGGNTNYALMDFGAVGGGRANWAMGSYSTIPGGLFNSADGDFAFAAGRRAKASHPGAFVWGDSTDADIASTAANQFIARASGGARFVGGDNWDLGASEGDFRIGNDAYRLKVGVSTNGGGAGDVWMRTEGGTGHLILWTSNGVTIFSNDNKTAGVVLNHGAGSWSTYSDRAAKSNVVATGGKDILARLASIPVTTWNYNSQDTAIRHIGPMAQDFYAAFGVGEDDTHISTVDADGVALAAIQGLYEVVQEQGAEIQDLQARVTALETRGGEKSDGAALPGLVAGGIAIAIALFSRKRTGGA